MGIVHGWGGRWFAFFPSKGVSRRRRGRNRTRGLEGTGKGRRGGWGERKKGGASWSDVRRERVEWEWV
jgi:hypothetical protein